MIGIKVVDADHEQACPGLPGYFERLVWVVGKTNFSGARVLDEAKFSLYCL